MPCFSLNANMFAKIVKKRELGIRNKDLLVFPKSKIYPNGKFLSVGS